MAAYSTPDADISLAAGGYSIDSTGPVRIVKKRGAGDFVPIGDCPKCGHGGGVEEGYSATAQTVQVWLLNPAAKFTLTQ